MSSSVGTVCLKYFVHIHASLFLKVVDVLSHTHIKDTFISKHLDKVVCRGGVKLGKIEVQSELVESFRLVEEVIHCEDSFGVGQVILFQVRVDTCLWATEIRDSC